MRQREVQIAILVKIFCRYSVPVPVTVGHVEWWETHPSLGRSICEMFGPIVHEVLHCRPSGTRHDDVHIGVGVEVGDGRRSMAFTALRSAQPGRDCLISEASVAVVYIERIRESDAIDIFDGCTRCHAILSRYFLGIVLGGQARRIAYFNEMQA